MVSENWGLSLDCVSAHWLLAGSLPSPPVWAFLCNLKFPQCPCHDRNSLVFPVSLLCGESPCISSSLPHSNYPQLSPMKQQQCLAHHPAGLWPLGQEGVSSRDSSGGSGHCSFVISTSPAPHLEADAGFWPGLLSAVAVRQDLWPPHVAWASSENSGRGPRDGLQKSQLSPLMT